MQRTYIVRSLSGKPYQVVMMYGNLELVVYVNKDLGRCHEVVDQLKDSQ